MDKALYERLRDKLRREEDESNMRLDFIYTFLDRLQGCVNSLTGQGQKNGTCEWGSLNGDEDFTPRNYVGGSTDLTFALRINFFDAKGEKLFSPIFQLTAEIKAESLVVRYDESNVEVPLTECLGERALTEIAGLLDAPLREAVEGPPHPYD